MTAPGDHRSGDHKLSRTCRSVLRGATREDAGVREHVDACTFCRKWLQRREHLTGLLAQPVEVPAELHSPLVLDGIRERIVADSEDSPLGQVLRQTMPLPSPQAEEWPQPVLESDLVETGLASQIRTLPVGPPEWSEVRDSVLTGQTRLDQARTARTRMFAGVGVAAAIVMCALLLRENERLGQPGIGQPEIVITDITSVSGFGYSPMGLLRNGRQVPNGRQR